ncbi:MAG: type III-B CRISPR module RAMP protein Cmr4 [Deltaproteobacteria bacterium]|nr:type III-B CRISPR module RAMP protein Cmr4 [Deltaproteobacteria bacterium]
MLQNTMFLFIYTETPVHAGTGQGLGTIALPIQRERITGYPIIQASTLKGRLRAESDPKLNSNSSLDEKGFNIIFGLAGEGGESYAGALSFSDARILLLPVRSLKGVFAWVTSRQVLQRLQRDLAIAQERNNNLTPLCNQLSNSLQPIRIDPPEPQTDTDERWALVGTNSEIVAGNMVVLKEFAYVLKSGGDIGVAVGNLGKWLAENTLPDDHSAPEYEYWRQALPKHLVILPEDDFRDFCQFGMEIATRVALDSDKKCVSEGPWTEEMLPAETLLYAPLHSTPARMPDAPAEMKDAAKVLEKVRGLNLTRTVLGGDETIGRGIVSLRFLDGVDSARQTEVKNNGTIG